MSRRRARCVRCSSAIASSSRVSSAMRSRILRRSSSRLDSPAPLPPMPPRWRSFPLPCSRRRGTMYWRRTISTCAFAARERAWRRKISRMTAVRSSTSTPVAFSRLRACDGEMSWSTSTASIGAARRPLRRPSRSIGRSSISPPSSSSASLAPASPRLSSSSSPAICAAVRPASACSSASLPLPSSAAGCSVLRRWVTVATTSTPSVRPRRRSSAIDAAKAWSSTPGS